MWLAVGGWLIVGGLAIIALMRIFAWDDVELFALFDTLTLFVFLPAWIVAIVALAGRRVFLGAAALVIVGTQIAFLAPELLAAQPIPRWASHASTFRLFDANVYFLNQSMAGYAREIRAYRPQLVTLEEATPLDAKRVEDSGAVRDLPHRLAIGTYDSKSFFIASRYPMRDTRVVRYDGAALVVQTTVQFPSRSLAVWVVHTYAPTGGSFLMWKAQLHYVARLIAARGNHGLLVVGDFNATWGNRGFHAVLDAGMTDGAAARGRAFDMTWTQNRHPLPPLVRIDHVLTGSGVAVTKIRTGPGPGSDHRDEMATVAIKP